MEVCSLGSLTREGPYSETDPPSAAITSKEGSELTIVSGERDVFLGVSVD